MIDSRLRNLRTLLSSFVLGCSEKLSYIYISYILYIMNARKPPSGVADEAGLMCF